MCTSLQSNTCLCFAPRLQEACAFDVFTNTGYSRVSKSLDLQFTPELVREEI